MMIIRKLHLLIFTGLLTLIYPLAEVRGQIATVVSYNIRLDIESDEENSWVYRKKDMVELISDNEPAIFGIQEGLPHQVEFLDSCLARYSFIGVGRDDGINQGEYCAIFYDTVKFKVIDHSTFWLSETPGEVSIGWDAAYKRICTYSLFENLQSEKRLWIFNTHLDNVGRTARKKSAELIVSKIGELNNNEYPVLLMGDLNAIPDDEPVGILKSMLDDGKEISIEPFTGPEGTFNGFSSGPVVKRIDYIFCYRVTVISYQHLDDNRFGNRQVSDHLAVLAIINL